MNLDGENIQSFSYDNSEINEIDLGNVSWSSIDFDLRDWLLVDFRVYFKVFSVSEIKDILNH